MTTTGTIGTAEERRLVIFLERSKNRTAVFSSILGTISRFFMCMTVWSFFGVHGSMYLPWNLLRSWPWALPSGLTELVASGFALRTGCACGLRLCPQDLLHSWPCLGFALRTRCARDFFFCTTPTTQPPARCVRCCQRGRLATRVGRRGRQATRAGALGVWRHLQRQRLAAEVKGGNRRLCDRRLWRQAAAAVAAAAALAAAVEAEGYGGDGRLWRRRIEQRQQSQCVFFCVCASHLKKYG